MSLVGGYGSISSSEEDAEDKVDPVLYSPSKRTREENTLELPPQKRSKQTEVVEEMPLEQETGLALPSFFDDTPLVPNTTTATTPSSPPDVPKNKSRLVPVQLRTARANIQTEDLEALGIKKKSPAKRQ